MRTLTIFYKKITENNTYSEVFEEVSTAVFIKDNKFLKIKQGNKTTCISTDVILRTETIDNKNY